MWSKRFQTVLVASMCLVGCAGEEPAAPAPESTLSQQVTSKPVALEQVPLAIHRRAAQLLEDTRGTDSAPKWKSAVFAPSVQVLYRPDVKGVAYYEFSVLVDGTASGFIVASSAEHDFPIAHWNFDGPSPSQALAKAASTEVSAFYKLDTLTYLAEGAKGEHLAVQGSLPPRIIGQDPSWLNKSVEPSTATWTPDQIPPDDSKPESITGKLVLSGPTPNGEVKLDGWSSWAQLRDGYAASYATMAASLKNQAAGEWETIARVQESGEGLVVGRPLSLALLWPKPSIGVTGTGAGLVKLQVVDTAPGRQKLTVTASDAQKGQELSAVVHLKYGNGITEDVSFVLLSPDEVGTTDGSGKSSASRGPDSGVRWAEVGTMDWSAWNQFFAGTDSEQRLYDQIPAVSPPNISACSSGCGATAWAMLFGWGDYQAALGRPGWVNRFGLYRQGGGYGADAVAPQYMDTGVRNMTWELRNWVGTFCVLGGNGATYPWNMANASHYLAGRAGAGLITWYNTLGIHMDWLRVLASDSIVNRHVPAIIGTGWLSHYPLAYGYRWRSRTVRHCFIWCWNDTEYEREFYVNQGWGGSSNGWVGAGTWFAGQLYAN